jgi:hypothetical protein
VSDYSEAFNELVDAAQPDRDPVLTKGDGTTPDLTKELDRILERHRTPSWSGTLGVKYGARVLPAAGNGHVYRAVRGGTTGGSEPAWPAGDYSRVSDGTVIWEEDGRFVGSPYDVRGAIHEACQMKADKCSDRVDSSADGASYRESQTAEYWLKRARRYAPVGVA